MTKKQKKYKETRRNFLLTFFEEGSKGKSVEVNGYILEKQVHGVTGELIVAIYPKDSYERREFFNQSQQHLKNI